MDGNKAVINGINQEKGYGFIKVNGIDKDVFFHAQTVGENTDFKTLKKGDEVFFDTIEQTVKGDQARGVRIA